MNPLPEHRKNLKIVTRDGTFQVGQVFAFASLALAYHDRLLHLVRSSDPAEMEDADIVFDAGGRYDPQRRRFDHDRKHRPSERDGVRLGAFGLIWQHLGLLAVSSVCPEIALPTAVAIWRHVDMHLVRPIDAGGHSDPGCPRAPLAGNLNEMNLLRGDDDVSDDAFFNAAGVANALLWRTIATASGDLTSGQAAGSMRRSGYERSPSCHNRCTGARSCRPVAVRMVPATA